MAVNCYNNIAKVLHWLIVVLLLTQFAVAWTMPDIGRDTKPVDLVAWHLSIGVFILLVMLFRAGWRVVSAVPAAPADLLAPLQLLSRATHFLLYAILIVLPVLGWINANARGWTVRLFGAIPLPSLVSSGSPWGREMGDVHQHQFVLRDGLLRRMLPNSPMS